MGDFSPLGSDLLGVNVGTAPLIAFLLYLTCSLCFFGFLAASYFHLFPKYEL
jgi:Na+/phosphate symporter